MTYATRADIEELFGTEYITDLFDDGVDENQALASALSRASAEINTHLSARYDTPISGQPEALKTPCINIAIYNLAVRHTHLTEAIRERYKDSVDLLKRIADGKAGLGEDEPKVSSDSNTSDGGASFSANTRLFSRGSLK